MLVHTISNNTFSESLTETSSTDRSLLADFRKVRMMVPWMVEDALVITTSVSLGIYLFVVFPRAFAVIAMAVLAVAGASLGRKHPRNVKQLRCC